MLQRGTCHARRYCPRHFPRYIFSMIKVLCNFWRACQGCILKNRSFGLSDLQLIGSSLLLSIRSFSMFHSGRFCFAGVGFRLLAILFKIVIAADVSFCGCRTLRPKTFPLMWNWRFKFRSFDSDCNKTWTNQDLRSLLWRSKGTLHAQSQCIILQSPRELLQT